MIIGEKVNSRRNEVHIMATSAPLNKIYKCHFQECKIETLAGIIEWKLIQKEIDWIMICKGLLVPILHIASILSLFEMTPHTSIVVARA